VPSATDIESMTTQLRRRGLERYVGLILKPDSYYPAWATAYIARRDGGRVVVEPAEITED